MRIFYDSGKTFLPRIDRIYLQTRALALLLLVGWFALGLTPKLRPEIAFGTIGVLLVHYIALLFITRHSRVWLQRMYLVTLVMDVAVTTIWIGEDGGLSSAFYIGYYLIISFGAYLLTGGAALIVASIATLSYGAIVFAQLTGFKEWITFTMHISPCWVFLAVISHVAEHLRLSESRLLKLFDTLNMRTAELEKTQAQLESIYDNSRILAGILDVDEVMKAVMQIVNGVLKYPAAAVLLKQGEQSYVYRGRVIDGEINLRLRSLESEDSELIHRVAKAGSPVRIVDLASREDYNPLKPDARSVMMAPMTVRRSTVGVLVAESTSHNAFSERDEKMFWVVARSAAMAVDNALVHEEMESLTVTDDLTGVFNYRYFTLKLNEEQRRAARYEQPLGLIMLDIDHFKRFNDTFGHEAGNLTLKGVADVVKGCIRDTDILSRYGGEEFALILPQTTLIEARQIANRIRESVERTRFNIGQTLPKQSVTVSVGVTSFPENGKSHDELLHLADQALYRAKGSGRNLVKEI